MSKKNFMNESIWSILLSGKDRAKKWHASSLANPILRQALLLRRSARRRSNSSKYKEESGYAPTMYTDTDNEGKLLVDDLVFIQEGEEGVKRLIDKKS